MKTMLLIFLFAVLPLSINTQSKSPASGKLEMRTLFQDATSFKSDQPWVFVIQSAKDEEGFRSRTGYKAPFALVDYSKETVVCVLGGKREKPGTKLSIDSILTNAEGARIAHHEESDKSKAYAGLHPAHIVAVTKAKISFAYDEEWFRKHVKQ
jgi:hypothetical protein